MLYFFGNFGIAAIAHTPLGWFTVCVPICLVMYCALGYLHVPIARLLPSPYRDKIGSLPRANWPRSWKSVFLLFTAFVLGAATHGTWDSFTHAHGFVVKASPLLQKPVFALFGHTFPVYNLLQHGSTLFGLLAVGISLSRWSHRQAGHGRLSPSIPEGTCLKRLLFLSLAAGALAVLVVSSYVLFAVQQPAFSATVVRFVLVASGAFILMLSIYAIRADRRIAA
jgi:predicted signal transduction protein with EAL and GGDEF domain